MSSVVIKSIDEPGVRRAMDAYAAQLLATRPEVIEIVVFGSFEKGTYAPGSDLDVFIMLEALDVAVSERVAEMMPRGFPVPVDLFPFTRAEVAARSPSSFLDEIQSSSWRYGRSGRSR